MKAKAGILALVLVLLCAVFPPVAFAAEGTLTGADQSHIIDVQAKYASGVTTPDVYSIDVVWGSMQFTYTTTGTREWDPTEHQYRDNSTSEWTATGNTITVTNHSNRVVDVKFSYEKATGFDGVSGAFSVSSDTLNAGTVGDVAGADSVSTTLTLSGVLASTVTEFTKVGSVTVSLQ